MLLLNNVISQQKCFVITQACEGDYIVGQNIEYCWNAGSYKITLGALNDNCGLHYQLLFGKMSLYYILHLVLLSSELHLQVPIYTPEWREA